MVRKPWSAAAREQLLTWCKEHPNGALNAATADLAALGYSSDALRSAARRLGYRLHEDKFQGSHVPNPTATDPATLAELQHERRRAAALEQHLKHLIETHETPVREYRRPCYRFGALGDTHLGSRYDRHDLLDKAYDILKAEGIEDVYHAGDLTDGRDMYRGQEFELDDRGNGFDPQVKHVIDSYPRREGMRTFVVGGNHDYSFVKTQNASVFDRICGRDLEGHELDGARDDLIWCGWDEATITVRVAGTPVQIMLCHPASGSSYAVSYRSQKMVEALPGGRKPHVMLIGHYHKAELLPIYRNVAVFQTGCLQSQTPHFMRPRGLQAHMGFWIVEVRTTKTGIASVGGTFVSFFEM